LKLIIYPERTKTSLKIEVWSPELRYTFQAKKLRFAYYPG